MPPDGEGSQKEASSDLATKKLHHRIETLMGEFRILVPALGALLGFQLVTGMQKTYEELPAFYRGLNFVGVLCTLLAFGFMLIPASYHRMLPRLDESREFIQFAQRCLAWGFLFLGLSLSLSLYLQAARSFQWDIVAAIAVTGIVIFFVIAWWLFPRALVRHGLGSGRSGEGRRGD